jgi:hypothetical protein
MAAVVVGAVYAFYFVVAAREAAGRRRRHAMLSAAWSAMGNAASDTDAGTVTGVVRGLPTTFCVRGDAAHVEVSMPCAALVAIVQRRVMPAPVGGEPGAVRTGDDAFDDAYFVEGAPADVLGCLLGAELRARLLAVRPLSLTIADSALELRGLASLDPAEIPAIIDLATQAAADVPRAIALADRQLTQVVGSPYRPTVDATAVHAAQAAREEEMAGFLELTRERALAARRALVLAAVLGAILVVSLYASGS